MRLILVVAVAVLAAACQRQPRLTPPAGNLTERHQVTERRAGPPPETPAPDAAERRDAPDEETLAEGRTFYNLYNCAGCHAAGGGAIGPALMDDEWIYGFEPADIFASIVEGRANGMPSFRNKVPDYQVWQLVAYVQSMSGQTPIDASPGRSDHMQTHTPEMITPYQGRVQTGHK
jgi:cytochrome c oxidase cbb3-type subunit 3